MRIISLGCPVPSPNVDNHSIANAPSIFDYDACIMDMQAVSEQIEGIAASTLNAEAVARERAYASHYLNLAPEAADDLHWRCIRMLMASSASLVVTPVQDVLGLGSDARMNTPGTETGNWGWRLLPTHLDALAGEPAQRLRTLTQTFGRTEDKQPPV